jgi:hypothetical protein
MAVGSCKEAADQMGISAKEVREWMEKSKSGAPSTKLKKADCQAAAGHGMGRSAVPETGDIYLSGCTSYVDEGKVFELMYRAMTTWGR